MRIGQVDNPLACGDQILGACVHHRYPAQGLMWWRDVVAVGRKITIGLTMRRRSTVQSQST